MRMRKREEIVKKNERKIENHKSLTALEREREREREPYFKEKGY